jgi:ribonuclease D
MFSATKHRKFYYCQWFVTPLRASRTPPYNELVTETPSSPSGTRSVKPPGDPPEPLPERLVTQPAELSACVDHLARCRRLGLDTEFVGENSYHPQLCLIQVATSEALYLIDPLTVGPLDAFWSVVVDPANEIVVHAGREEIRICYLACGKTPAHLVDMQLAAGLAGLNYPLGHGPLVKEVLGISLSKGETLTEWGKRPLTKSQIRYAFDDVRFLLAIWDRLSARLDELGRRAWAAEECDRLIAAAIPDAPAEAAISERFRKLRGVGALDRRRLAIVRELFTWREEAAAKHNRPSRTIVRDDLLLEIARRNPTKERDLHVIRGLPKRDLEAIVQAVARARALPIDQCPVVAERDQDPAQVGMVAAILMAVLGDVCARRHLAANLVATTQDVKLLVRARFQNVELPAESLLTRGWRREYILPDLLAVLDGRRAVGVADVRREAPLTYQDRGAS